MVNTKTCLCLGLMSSIFSYSVPALCGTTHLQIGAFTASQGRAQHVNIEDLIGNNYVVNDGDDSNALFGLGYYFDALENQRLKVALGLNGFYLGNTRVKGTIFQENLFPNLSYKYSVRNIPIYIAGKASIPTNNRFALTLDAGIGPNFKRTSGYTESALDPITLPASNSFSSNNNVAFSAMAGAGVRIRDLFGKDKSLECGYRFFYLGKGQLSINNSQILNTISTGNSHANAVLCALVI
jgi:hypothetical protein